MRWQFSLKTLHLEIPEGPEVLSLIGSRSLWSGQLDAGQCSGLMCGVVHSGSQVAWGENPSLPALRGLLFYTLLLNDLTEDPNKTSVQNRLVKMHSVYGAFVSKWTQLYYFPQLSAKLNMHEFQNLLQFHELHKFVQNLLITFSSLIWECGSYALICFRDDVIF